MYHLKDQTFEFREVKPVLLTLLFFGFLVRITGILWGMPFFDSIDGVDEGTYHPDEYFIVGGAVAFPGHVWTNTNLVWPTFFPYVLGIICMPLRLLFDALNLPHSTSYYFVVVMGRFCSVLAGTGAILLTYLLAQEIYDSRRALLASIFLAFSFYHAQNSSFVTPDVLTSFLFILFLITLRRAFLEPQKTSLYALSGVVLGLLVGTKYNGAIAAIVILVMYVYTITIKPPVAERRTDAYNRKWHFNLALCGSVAMVVFFVTTPGIFLQYGGFIESMNRLKSEVMRSDLPKTDPTTWVTVFRTLVEALGWPLALLFITSLCFPCRKNIYEGCFIVCLILYFVYFGANLIPRYVVMFMPLIAMIASNGALWFFELPGRTVKILGATAIFAVIGISLSYCVVGAYLRYDDTRTQAAHYIQENIPARSSIGIVYAYKESDGYFFSPEHPKIDFSRFKYLDFQDYPQFVITSSYDLNRIEDALKSDKLSSDYIWDKRFNRQWWKDSPPSPRMFRFYANLLHPTRSKYVLLKRFKKAMYVPIEFGSPEVRIYRALRPDGEHDLTYRGNPHAYSDQDRQIKWRLQVLPGNKVQMIFPKEKSDVVRLSITSAETIIPWHIQLNQDYNSVNIEHQYRLTFRARADQRRNIVVGVAKAHAPWDNLGFYKEIVLTQHWQNFEFKFKPIADDASARIHFDVGGNIASVDLSDVTLLELPKS